MGDYEIIDTDSVRRAYVDRVNFRDVERLCKVIDGQKAELDRHVRAWGNLIKQVGLWRAGGNDEVDLIVLRRTMTTCMAEVGDPDFERRTQEMVSRGG